MGVVEPWDPDCVWPQPRPLRELYPPETFPITGNCPDALSMMVMATVQANDPATYEPALNWEGGDNDA